MPKALLCLVLATSAFAQEPIKPTREHEILASDAGTWDATITSYLIRQGGKPTVHKGTEVNTLLAGGLWLDSAFDANIGGKKFQGRGHYGYDPLKKKYVGTWIDSMSPVLSLLEGQYDAKSKTMTYEGEYIDFGDKTRYTQRVVTTLKDDGTRSYTLTMKPDGSAEEVKIMEITYTKRN
jgi:hypothetical protein